MAPAGIGSGYPITQVTKGQLPVFWATVALPNAHSKTTRVATIRMSRRNMVHLATRNLFRRTTTTRSKIRNQRSVQLQISEESRWESGLGPGPPLWSIGVSLTARTRYCQYPCAVVLWKLTTLLYLISHKR